MLHDPDLPDALREMEGDVAPAHKQSVDARMARLQSLGTTIGTKRDEAVKARKESGIEAVWTAAEEAYLGVDEVNRPEFAGSRWAKPTSSGGPLTRETDKKPGNKSTAFVPLTARYVDMGFAKVSEIILPIDDKPFSIDSTPIPDMVAGMKDTTPVAGADGQPAANQDGSPVTKGQLFTQQVEAAKAKAKKEEDWIYDNFVECNYPREMRKVLFDAARIGTGVLKGPIPTESKSQSFSIETSKDGRKAGVLKIVKTIKPAVTWMDPWNLFPAPGCGENVHDGDHILERDYFSAGKLKGLKALRNTQTGAPLYLAEQIDKVIVEGPGQMNTAASDGQPQHGDRKNQYELWTFYGELSVSDMKDLGAEGVDDLPDSLTEVFAIVTLVNNTVIRATINPLDSGSFPYRVMSWQRRAGYWAGVGIGERVDVPQKMINGATRAMLNNAGKSGGSQIVMDRRAIEPADGSWDLNTGDKVWLLTGQALVEDVRQIFLTYNIPNVTPQMLTIIDYALKLAEQSTNLPLVAQGQVGKDDPETFGQAELQNNNANVLLRSIAWEVDDNITEPTVNDFHEWYLLDPEVPDEDKGDFKINAKGSIAMVERAIQEQTYVQLLPLSMDPRWGQNPVLMMEQYLKIKRLNPKDTAYTDAERQKMASAQPPEAPQVTVAKINAQAKLHTVDMQHGHERGDPSADRDAETKKYVEDSRASAEANRAQQGLEAVRLKGQFDLEELHVKRELALLDYAQKHSLTLMQVQGQLANTALQIKADRELQGADHALTRAESLDGHAVDLHKHHTGLEATAQQAQQAAAQVQANTGDAA